MSDHVAVLEAIKERGQFPLWLDLVAVDAALDAAIAALSQPVAEAVACKHELWRQMHDRSVFCVGCGKEVLPKGAQAFALASSGLRGTGEGG